MLAFEVVVDGERMCRAGMEDWAVMSVILSAVRHRDRNPDDEGEIELSVGGLTERDAQGVAYHTRWVRAELKPESKVTIQMLGSDHPDEPKRRHRSDRVEQESPFTDEEIEEMERADWLRLKEKFEPMGNQRSPD